MRPVVVLLVLVLYSCSAADPAPRTLVPPTSVPLAEVLQDELVAVVDTVDERPEVERFPLPLNDNFISGHWAPSSTWYWYLRGSSLDELPADAWTEEELPVRLTGRDAFRWYRHPYAGVGGGRSAPLTVGLADYLAIALENRRIVTRVVRARDLDEARSLGATYALESTALHLVGGLVEVPEPSTARPDDVVESYLVSRVDLGFRLVRVEDSHLLWEQSYASPGGPDPLNLFDQTEDYRGMHAQHLLRLDQERQPRWAFDDIVDHVDRRLTAITRETVAATEAALRKSFPID